MEFTDGERLKVHHLSSHPMKRNKDSILMCEGVFKKGCIPFNYYEITQKHHIKILNEDKKLLYKHKELDKELTNEP